MQYCDCSHSLSYPLSPVIHELLTHREGDKHRERDRARNRDHLPQRGDRQSKDKQRYEKSDWDHETPASSYRKRGGGETPYSKLQGNNL